MAYHAQNNHNQGNSVLLKSTAAFLPSLVLCAGMVTSAIAQSSSLSLMQGAFSEAQAVRGQELYFDNCLQCHGETMSGVDQAPPLAGPQFAANWRGESLSALVDRMTTMPPDKPGQLNREAYVDLLTYILWFNELPLGTSDLTTDREVLSAMPFETPGF
jgi:mono/diheme cytochrome c family protein